MNHAEILGLAATVIIFLSTTQDGAKFRWLNLIGSIMFVVYGIWISALSVWVMNGLCAITNAYKLIQLSKDKSIKSKDKSVNS